MKPIVRRVSHFCLADCYCGLCFVAAVVVAMVRKFVNLETHTHTHRQLIIRYFCIYSFSVEIHNAIKSHTGLVVNAPLRMLWHFTIIRLSATCLGLLLWLKCLCSLVLLIFRDFSSLYQA